MHVDNRISKRCGWKTGRVRMAPLVFFVTFAAVCGLCPQRAWAAALVIQEAGNSASDGQLGISGTTPGAVGTDQTYRIENNAAVNETDPLSTVTGVSTDGVTITGGTGGVGAADATNGPGGNAGTITVNAATGTEFGNVGGGTPSTIAGGIGGNGGAGGVAAAGSIGGIGGTTIFTIGNTTTIYDTFAIQGGAGGNGGDGDTGGAGGDGGIGGEIIFNGGGSLNSVTTVYGNIAVTSGNGGTDGTPNTGAGGLGGLGGAVNVDITGTVKFVEGTTPVVHTLDFARGTSITNGDTAAVHSSIGTLEAVGTEVRMTLTGLDFNAAQDYVDFGTLKLTNGGIFATTDTVIDAYNSADPAQQYRVTSLYVSGLDNIWNTAGTYTPALMNIPNGGKLTFDVTGVSANPGLAMLTTYDGSLFDYTLASKAAVVDFDGFALAANRYGNPNLEITAGTKAEHRALIGEDIILIDGATGWTNSQWGAMGTTETANTVRYYAQNGTSRFYYDTYGEQGTGTNPDMLRAIADGELSAATAYSQYQAAVAETAGDIFMDNTWPAIRNLADTLQPCTFGIVARGSYFSVNQDQDYNSEVDKDQWAAALAGGFKYGTGTGEFTFGAFFEYGHGKYDTATIVPGWGNAQGLFGPGPDRITGHGDADLYGGGLFAHHKFEQGTYIEAGARLGYVKQKYRMYGHGLDNRADFDGSDHYWGIDLGLGQQIKFNNDNTRLDLYGRFLWTHLQDKDYNNGYGEQMRMESVDSLRTRLGARIDQNLGDGGLGVYAGAAWEQEWDGNADGVVAGRRIFRPANNNGASAFGELGVSYKPRDKNLAVEAGVFGLTGKQQAFGGSLGFVLGF